MDEWLTRAGTWLAAGYIGYGMFLTFACLVGVHVSVLILLACRRDPRRFRRLALAAEVVYGLIHPVLYLLFLQHMFHLERVWALDAAAWLLLAAFWGVRLWGGLGAPEALRRTVRALCWAALAFVVAYGLKDGWVAASSHVGWQGDWLIFFTATNIVALYLVPLPLLRSHLRATADAATWDGGRWFFPLGRRFAIASAAVLAITLLLWHLPRTESAVRRRVLTHREDIVAAASRNGLDARLVASIVYVLERDASPFARELERLAAGLWLSDDSYDVGLERFDLSLGLAQIKPTTAFTAVLVYATAPIPAPVGQTPLDVAMARRDAAGRHDSYTGLPSLSPAWRLPPAAVARLHPLLTDLMPREAMVDALFDDRENLDLCALILALYAAQWESANPAWSVRERPEILATLYQLGFERSVPKAEPRPDPFGERVREVYDSDWMRRQFGAP